MPDDLQRYGQDKAKEIYQRRDRRRVEVERASADNRLKAAWAPKLGTRCAKPSASE